MVTIHAAREELPDVVAASFRELVESLKKEGISVPLGIETMGDEGEFGSLDDVLEIVRKVPGTGIVIDIAHIYARTDGELKSVEDFEEIFDRVDRATKSGYHIHFSGIEHKGRREVRHLPLGEGGPDMKMFARALVMRERDATVICESPLLEEDALKLKKAFASASRSDKYK
jgi:Endonuclease IV